MIDLIGDHAEIMKELLRLHDEHVDDMRHSAGSSTTAGNTDVASNSNNLRAFPRYMPTMNYRDWASRSMSVFDLLEELWSEQDSLLRWCMSSAVHLQLNDFYECFEYWLNNIARLKNVSCYEPTDEDLIRAKVKTTGVVVVDQFRFKKRGAAENMRFSMIDCGGQRNERRKWPRIFAQANQIDAVIFFASLSEFNQSCYEDESVNRLHESLNLFNKIMNIEIGRASCRERVL